MIAYNKLWLSNLFRKQETGKAFAVGCISKDEHDAIVHAHPVLFYTPNIFIRIGLFILTFIAILFSFSLFVLAFLRGIEDLFSGLLIFFSLLCFAGLEFVIHEKKSYQSGVDDAFLWGAAIAFVSGMIALNNFDGLGTSVVIFFISAVCSIRYADRLMAALCFLSFLGIIFFLCKNIGGSIKTVLPFILMIISLVVYFFCRRNNDKSTFNVYSHCMKMIEITSLLSLYTAGNYFVVRETSDAMFNLNLQPGQSIPFGFLFWIFTAAIPLIYLFSGIKKKDRVLTRTGLILIAAIVFTFRHYHAILLPEIAMILAGSLMIVLAWALIRYLASPKAGFTSEELQPANSIAGIQIESLILAETFSQQPQPNANQFGGGSFGGGGTSSDF